MITQSICDELGILNFSILTEREKKLNYLSLGDPTFDEFFKYLS